ncbi:RHS repeat-associated core domain-containing protein [Pseudomonas sp. LB3P31]
MQSLPTTQLCRYGYDPLDRLISQTRAETQDRLRFYCKNRLTTEIEGTARHSIVQHGDRLLAQQKKGDCGAITTGLLASDSRRSVLTRLEDHQTRETLAYSPYGHCPPERNLPGLLSFNGERRDQVSGHYLLGNGYRAFNPFLMRFNSPDSWSPFGKGGLNSYAYCQGDPANNTDSSGHLLDAIVRRMFNKWRSNTKLLTKRAASPKLYVTNELSTSEDRMVTHPYYPLEPGHHFPITKLSSAKDLASIPSPSELSKLPRTRSEILGRRPKHLNFIFTAKKELFVSTTGHQYLSDMTGNPELISAGQLSKFEGGTKLTIENNSGHFIPDYWSLKPVREHLESLGVKKITAIRKWK